MLPSRQRSFSPPRKASRNPQPRRTPSPPYNDDTEDPAEWGKAFPKHYELYKKTVDMQRTKHGGSEAVPRKATQADPRSVAARSKSDEDAGLRAIWAGYAFAADFREERGHAYMLEEKFKKARMEMAKHVWVECASNNSQACRNCHQFSKEVLAKQKEIARSIHAPVLEGKATCIDCHKGIAHTAP